jgi:Mrp family chromosome partitioning ATPase
VGEKTDQYNAIKLDLKNTQQLYQTLYLKTQQLKVNSSYSESNAELYDSALPALRPSKPNKPLFIMMVFVLSFIFGVIYVIVRVALNTKIEDITQVKSRLGVLPLGELCQFDMGRSRLSWLESVQHHEPLADTVYGIRSELLAKVADCRLFGVASAEDGEGASSVATLFGMGFSQDQKTLLIDLDTSKTEGGLSFDFNAKDHLGFGEAIENNISLSECVMPLMPNFDFLPHGQFKQSPLLVFSQSEWVEIIKSWLSQYDRILVDLPAVNDSKAAQLVASKLDGLLFVLQSNREDSAVLVKAVDKLEDHQVNVFAAVLNRVAEEHLYSEENRALARDFSTAALTSGQN